MPEITIEDVKNDVKTIGTAFEQFKAANDERLSEIEARGNADPLLEEKLDKINETISAAQDRMDKFEAAQKRAPTKFINDAGEEVDLDAKAQRWADLQVKSRPGRMSHFEFDHAKMTEYKGLLLDKFCRYGKDDMSQEEIKALSVGSDPDGGYTVHPDMNGRVVQQVYESSPMRQYASVQTITTDSLEGLFDLNEAGFGWVGETASRAETTTPELGQWRIPVHEMYAFPMATQKLLDDSSLNMEAWLSGKISERFARAEATAFCTGDGVDQPRGFLTYASGTTLPGTIEQTNTGASGDFAGSGAGGDVFFTIYGKMKAPYKANAIWAMNRTTEAAVRKIKDSNGAYVWQAGLAPGNPATIAGRPVVGSFEDMADIAANSLSIALANFREGYQVVDRMGIRVLRDPFTNKPYVGLYATKRVGGDVVNFEAIKLMKFAA